MRYDVNGMGNNVRGVLCFIAKSVSNLSPSFLSSFEPLSNRFSREMYTVDEELVSTLRSYLNSLMSVISVVFVISSVTPMFTLCLVPIVIFYLHQQNYFTTTYREIKRIDSVSRSPIYALLGETLDGVTTIRAFRVQELLANRMINLMDR